MAPPDRRAGRALADRLAAEAPSFDFHRAVALLELLATNAVPVGDGVDPRREAVRFSAYVGFDFAPSAVQSITVPEDGSDEPARMTTAFLGLAGAMGPLPNAVTEMVLERARRKDKAFKDFLDLFNHRLIALLHRIRRRSRPEIAWTPPDLTPFAERLFALAGLGEQRLRDRMGVPDRALLRYVGLLAGDQRSMKGLEILLADYFAAPVQVRPFVGRWLTIDPEQRSELGVRGANNRLGDDLVLGGRVWDEQSCFIVALGPLSFERYCSFLPDGPGHRPLSALVRLFAGEEFDVQLTLRLPAPETRQTMLSHKSGSRLGWTSWLGTPPAPTAQPPKIVETTLRLRAEGARAP